MRIEVLLLEPVCPIMRFQLVSACHITRHAVQRYLLEQVDTKELSKAI